MPTIMTAHMANVRNTSAIVQGTSIIDMPMAAWNSISADIWRSRWTRYAHASAETRTRQVEIRRRSRRDMPAAVGGLSTPPGERRVLPVVLAAHVIPRQAQCMDVAPGRMGEREDIRRGMPGMREGERLEGRGVNPHRALSGHIDGTGCLDGPFHAVALETDRRGFHTQRLAAEAPESSHWTACRAAGNRGDRVALLGARPVVGDDPDRPVPLTHRSWREPKHDEAEAVQRNVAVVSSIDLKCHGERAGAFARFHGHLPRDTRADKVAATRLVVLPLDLPGLCRHRSPRSGANHRTWGLPLGAPNWRGQREAAAAQSPRYCDDLSHCWSG